MCESSQGRCSWCSGVLYYLFIYCQSKQALTRPGRVNPRVTYGVCCLLVRKLYGHAIIKCAFRVAAGTGGQVMILIYSDRTYLMVLYLGSVSRPGGSVLKPEQRRNRKSTFPCTMKPWSTSMICSTVVQFRQTDKFYFCVAPRVVTFRRISLPPSMLEVNLAACGDCRMWSSLLRKSAGPQSSLKPSSPHPSFRGYVLSSSQFAKFSRRHKDKLGADGRV
ncbi:hypothetical protein EDB89DRAFT_572287 [Lactarius sanguifluus]|nr:hypothetical protein EDB89DRAFT_572287 [Lactarius sanguifluus]